MFLRSNYLDIALFFILKNNKLLKNLQPITKILIQPYEAQFIKVCSEKA